MDFAPEVTQAIRKRLLVTRPRDDYKFYIDITLPRDYREGTRLPGIIWFYPTEFTTQAEYDQRRRTTNINAFPNVGPRSAEIWATQGYVVIQPVDIPIVGPTGRMNDHYVDELREDLDLTIEAVDKAGYLDRDRVGIGGHSYGAFSTVNAMTHTPYFKAGIAGDGMYNRTLTPFNFQNERRTLWEAKDTYLDMSPFLYADRLERRAADVSLARGSERRHRSDQLDPHDAGAAGAGKDRRRCSCIRTRITVRRRASPISISGRAGWPGSTST